MKYIVLSWLMFACLLDSFAQKGIASVSFHITEKTHSFPLAGARLDLYESPYFLDFPPKHDEPSDLRKFWFADEDGWIHLSRQTIKAQLKDDSNLSGYIVIRYPGVDPFYFSVVNLPFTGDTMTLVLTFRPEELEMCLIKVKDEAAPLISRDRDGKYPARTSPKMKLDAFDTQREPGELRADDVKSYLQSHIAYTDYTKALKLQGYVIVEFFVDPDGYTQHVTILRGLSADLDQQVYAAFANMPKFIPLRTREDPAQNVWGKFRRVIDFRLVD